MEETTTNEVWREWFQQHGPKLLLCARQWTRSLADAEDVVQEAFVRFWRNQRRLGGDPVPLLLMSIRRAAIDLGRRDTRRAAREQLAEEEGFFEAVNGTQDRARIIEDALRRLPVEQREVLTLKIWGELTFDEIARRLAIPLNTAASRYRYGLAALRKSLNPADCHG